MIWLTATEYMCHRVGDNSNTMGTACGAITAYPSGAPKFTPGF